MHSIEDIRAEIAAFAEDRDERDAEILNDYATLLQADEGGVTNLNPVLNVYRMAAREVTRTGHDGKPKVERVDLLTPFIEQHPNVLWPQRSPSNARTIPQAVITSSGNKPGKKPYNGFRSPLNAEETLD